MTQGANVEERLGMIEDAELLPLLQSGDAQAFRTIYNRHFKAVAWIALRFLGSRELSEDAAQATFIVLWEKSKGIELVGNSLMPWLATVCRLQCRNLQKKEQRRNHTPINDALHVHDHARSLEDRAVDAALVRSLEPEIAGLSRVDQEIFRLCLVNDLSYEVAAGRLNITHSAVRNRLSRLKLKLRTLLTTDD